MSVGQGEEEDELVSKKSAPSTIVFGNKNLSTSVHRSPSTEKLSMNNHNNKRPRASMDGFPMEDDCHPRTLNSKRFLSDAMANELGWKWSLEENNNNNNTQTETTTTTTTSLSMDGNQSRRQSMDLDTTSRENNNMIIISPSSMHGNNNNTTANALRRTVSASDVSGEDSLLNNGGGSMDLLRRRAMKYAQEQKNLKEFHFPKALEVVVADQEVEEEKEKSNSNNNSNPTTPRNDDNVLEEVAPASFYPASPSDQSPLMTNLRKAALLRSLSRGKQQQQQQQQQQRHGGK